MGLILIFNDNLFAKNNHSCTKGVLDLQQYDLKAAVPLNGEWCYKWQSFDERILYDDSTGYANLPGHWNTSSSLLYENQLGFGTYGLKILLPEAGKIWSIHLPPIHSSYKLFVNGLLISQVGNPSTGINMVPKVAPQVVSFFVTSKQVFIVLEVSNYNFVFGGILSPVVFGKPSVVEADRERSLIISAFLIGSLLIMGLYHFAIYALWKKDIGFLYFGIICLFIALRESFGGDALFFFLFPAANYNLSVKLLYLVFPICLIAFVQFFKSIYPEFSKFFSKLALILSMAFILVVLFSSNTVYGKYLPVISFLFLIEAIYLLFFLIKRSIKKPSENILALIGVIILFSCFVNDVLYEAEVINTYFLLPFGFFVFTLLQSIMLSIRFTNAFYKSELLSVELLKSQMRNRDMQAKFQKEILQSKLETQEFTFNQVSQEIHDNVGQLLSTVKMLLGTAIIKLESKTNKVLVIAEETLGNAIKQLRLLSKSLNTDWIHQFDLLQNIEAEKERINSTGITTLNVYSVFQQMPMEMSNQTILYRVIQESIQNCIKHALAKNIDIRIMKEKENILIKIKDDGNGFDIANAKIQSLGIRNMIYRVELLKGKIDWISEEGKGTLVDIFIPIEK